MLRTIFRTQYNLSSNFSLKLPTTFKTILLTLTPIELDIATANQWNNVILSCSPTLKPQKPTKHNTSLVTKSSSACLLSDCQKFSLLCHKMINTFPPKISIFYMKPWNPVPLIQRWPFIPCKQPIQNTFTRSQGSHSYNKQPQRPFKREQVLNNDSKKDLINNKGKKVYCIFQKFQT